MKVRLTDEVYKLLLLFNNFPTFYVAANFNKQRVGFYVLYRSKFGM